MTEEETFKKKYPEYCCGESLLSPYWDLWEDGAEYGYNKCFQQIRKLVNEHTRLDCIIPELLRLQEIE